MTRIHLIEREDRFTQMPSSPGEWESGFWVVPPETADRLVGGTIHFHKKQAERSYFGGEIVGHRTQEDGPYVGRRVFRFRFSKDCKRVLAGRDGWNWEQKIVL